ncbi:MAG: type IV pilus twitching motility protein PilT [Thermoanaerobaculia bacterium]|nr:type IV pilus twitching motility protein PilT [Thermoanaerobaculia bacterium]
MSEPRLHELFRYLVEARGSDLHLAAGLEPRIRRHGSLQAVPGWPVLTPESLLELLRAIASDAQWHDYQTTGDVDFAYGLEGVARFRVNLLRQERGPAAVFRSIPEKILPLESLGMPAAVERLAHTQSGLILVTGPTGSGKSTTLASILDVINRTYSKHIVTIEDPVEFVHQNRRSLFSHREVGNDTESFGSALRAAIRQDADVILVGEMRDLETIALAVTAAEMGSLVFGTLHTNSAISTVDRLIDAFPAEEQAQIRTTLADSLAGVVCQLLLPTAQGGGRVAAVEILLRTPGLANVIREGKTPMIQSLIQGGRALGMQRMDDALMELVESGRVSAEEAYRKANNKELFERMVKE